jgi:uncharacterized protein (UPF0210 family)
MSSIDFSELPRNAKLVCDNGQVYDAKHRCLLDMNEYGDIKYCRDMSHLQQCGKYQKVKNKCLSNCFQLSSVTSAPILLPFLSVALHESGISNALLGA